MKISSWRWIGLTTLGLSAGVTLAFVLQDPLIALVGMVLVTPVMTLLAGRCVGGTTTINTKVALRAHEKDFAKWHDASGIVGESGSPFGPSDLAPHYDRVEARLGVRERTDWRKSVHTVAPGFRALGAEPHPVRAYADADRMSCGLGLRGPPTNPGQTSSTPHIPRDCGAAAHGPAPTTPGL